MTIYMANLTYGPSSTEPNPAAAVDALVALALLSLHYWQRATAQRR